MQHIFARQGDLFKLAQSVWIQAYGGYGLEALRYFLTHVFLSDIGLAAPQVGVAIATCYLRWQNAMITEVNERQFMLDLFNTCEVVVSAPKSRLLVHLTDSHFTAQNLDLMTPRFDQVNEVLTALKDAQLASDSAAMASVIVWHRLGRHREVEHLLTQLERQYAHDHMLSGMLLLHSRILTEDERTQRQQVLMMIFMLITHQSFRNEIRPMCVGLDHNMLALRWSQLFPSHLALPVYSVSEQTDTDVARLELERLSLKPMSADAGEN